VMIKLPASSLSNGHCLREDFREARAPGTTLGTFWTAVSLSPRISIWFLSLLSQQYYPRSVHLGDHHI